MSEESYEETTEEKAMRIYFSEIIRQLLQRERFRRFFDCNYQVSTDVDPETQSFRVTLMELDPALAQQKLQNMLLKHAHENEPSIKMANQLDMQAIVGALKDSK